MDNVTTLWKDLYQYHKTLHMEMLEMMGKFSDNSVEYLFASKMAGLSNSFVQGFEESLKDIQNRFK